MAVYTKISRDELDVFLKDYALGDVQIFHGIKEGVENSNFRLVTSSGKFILTLFEQRTDVGDLPYFVALMKHGANKNLPCPHPIADHNGETLKTLNGRPALIVTELNGKAELQASAQHCRELGVLLAQFHLTAADFTGQRANRLSLAGWQGLIEKIGSSADKIEAGLSGELKTELDYLEHHWPRHLPQGTIHADVFPDNVLWDNQKVSGLIDFYFSCQDSLAYDLAICVNAWCFEPDRHHLDAAKTKALLQGYESIRPLNHAEHDSFLILCRGAALRFLCTRLHDLFHTPAGAMVSKKDPGEYLRKNRYFRALGQFPAEAA